eukprot:CAMPEP_0117751772 /NCGR_PEP_ID=MMETSP0947-20121206/11184_1 /TAXON_ID=44440 /ORGANISM="Chattonella subsalsa, Strain CCMP2191" /LENGTH=212 /DNA_ID=CAMNT_0005570237 /DNA_START=34 /DNA_END=672 /DNA_ORIENTATION=+
MAAKSIFFIGSYFFVFFFSNGLALLAPNESPFKRSAINRLGNAAQQRQNIFHQKPGHRIQTSTTLEAATDEFLSPFNILVFAGYAAAFGAAGFLMSSVYGGSFGLGAYLTSDKPLGPDPNAPGRGENQLPEFFKNLKLPQLDFVEVYGQPKAPSDEVIQKAEELRSQIQKAVAENDFEKAKAAEKNLEDFLLQNGIELSFDEPTPRDNDFRF